MCNLGLPELARPFKLHIRNFTAKNALGGIMSSKRDLNRVRRSNTAIVSDPFLVKLADQIRQARLNAGLKQEDLALVAGVGRTLILRLENASPGVSLGKTVKVLHALGLDLCASTD